jgi:adenylosuccinate synthase
VTEYDQLPANARAYVEKIEEVVGAPIAIVSTGPERNQNVILNYPFA